MRKAIVAVLLALSAAGCLRRTIPVPSVTVPTYPDFVAPTVPSGLMASRAGTHQDRGWRFLQAGDLRNAEREFQAALKASAGFSPAETGLGYLELARRNPKASLLHFDRAIERARDDPAPLIGRGQALAGLGREDEAVTAFEAALALDAGLVDVRRRVEVLRFRMLEGDLSRARQATTGGRLDEALAAYRQAIARSPESAVLYREMADVERRTGNLDGALEHLGRATALEPADAGSWGHIGEILEGRGDLEGAERAYVTALAIEPGASLAARLDAVRARAALARLPAEYRAIGPAAQITRADLAALIGVRLASVLQTGRRDEAVVLTDVRTSWAAPWIMTVARAGIIEPFANHAFQPRMLVRRVDLAQAVSRLLARLDVSPSERNRWSSARLEFSDLPAGHLAYVAASQAVACGAMTVGPDNAFQPSRLVTGAEATAAIDRLEALTAGPPIARERSGR